MFVDLYGLVAEGSATRDLALTWLVWFLPIALISAALLALLVWLFVWLRKCSEAYAVFAAGTAYEKKAIMDAVSGYFFSCGYRKKGREENEITFAKDSRYDLALGALLFLFFMLPGILYLVFFGRERLGRLYMQETGGSCVVAIEGPRKVIERARLCFEDRGQLIAAGEGARDGQV